MKPLRKFSLDLQACELEDRILPVIANLGVIVLTTGGYVLMTPYPGAAAYPGGSPGGTAIPTSFSITGSAGISSMQPGNITGIPGLATTGAAGSTGGAGATVTVGSGANDSTAVSISAGHSQHHRQRRSGSTSPDRPTVRGWVPCPAGRSVLSGRCPGRLCLAHHRLNRLADSRAGLRTRVLAIPPRFGCAERRPPQRQTSRGNPWPSGIGCRDFPRANRCRSSRADHGKSAPEVIRIVRPFPHPRESSRDQDSITKSTCTQTTESFVRT